MNGKRLDLRIPKVLQTRGFWSSEMPFSAFSTGYFQLINKYEEKCKYYCYLLLSVRYNVYGKTVKQ